MRLIIIFLVVAFTAGPAFADRKSARPHYKAGTRAYNLGHFEKAIESFEKAYAEDPAPPILYNIAQSHWQLKNNERALFFYRRYLDAAPRAKNRAAVTKRMTELQAELDAQNRAATEPAPPTAVPEPAKSAPAPEPTPEPEVAPKPAAVVSEPSPSSASETGMRTMQIAAYGTAGVAVVSLVTGAIFGAQAKSAGDDLSAADTFSLSDQEAGQQKETLQYVFLGIGAASAVASGVLFYLDIQRDSDDVAVAPFFTAHGSGISAQVGF